MNRLKHLIALFTDSLQYLILAVAIALAVAGLTHALVALDPSIFDHLSKLPSR